MHMPFWFFNMLPCLEANPHLFHTSQLLHLHYWPICDKWHLFSLSSSVLVVSRLLCSFVTCVLELLFALYILWMCSHLYLLLYIQGFSFDGHSFNKYVWVCLFVFILGGCYKILSFLCSPSFFFFFFLVNCCLFSKVGFVWAFLFQVFAYFVFLVFSFFCHTWLPSWCHKFGICSCCYCYYLFGECGVFGVLLFELDSKLFLFIIMTFCFLLLFFSFGFKLVLVCCWWMMDFEGGWGSVSCVVVVVVDDDDDDFGWCIFQMRILKENEDAAKACMSMEE